MELQESQHGRCLISWQGDCHYLIRTKVGAEVQQEEDMRIPGWKLDKANRDLSEI